MYIAVSESTLKSCNMLLAGLIDLEARHANHLPLQIGPMNLRLSFGRLVLQLCLGVYDHDMQDSITD